MSKAIEGMTQGEAIATYETPYFSEDHAFSTFEEQQAEMLALHWLMSSRQKRRPRTKELIQMYVKPRLQ